MAIIEEFEQTYNRDTAICWYTRPTFLFRLLNKALRQRNISVIFLFGFFLKDLHDQLNDEYLKYKQSRLDQPLLKVYRGQFISKYEIEKLNNIDCRIPFVINSFLSATADRDVSVLFLDSSNQEDEMACVLFEIEISFDKPCRPFADVTHLSHVPDEHEVLFSIGTLFELQDIRYDEHDRFWIAKLALHDRILLKDSTSVVETEREQLKGRLRDFVDLIFNSTFEEIDVIFEQFMRLFSSEKWIQAIRYHCLGEKDWFDNNNDRALENYQRAVGIWLDYSSDDELNCSIDIAELYERIAKCYRSMQKWTLVNDNFDLSIRFYCSVIARARTAPFRIAVIYHQCAFIYEEKSKISDRSIHSAMATECYEKELALLLEYTPFSNGNIRSCYMRLGALYKQDFNYYRAFQCYESALNILLQETEIISSSICHISQELVEICLKDKEPDMHLMIKYQLLSHEHLLIKHSPINQEWQRNIIAASQDKLADLYKASKQSAIAIEHQLSAAKLRDSTASSSKQS